MKLLKNIFYFFPVQITLLQFKKNLLFVFFWFFLYSIVSSKIGTKLGVPFLFLDPEYLGKYDYLSVFVLAVFIAIFIGSYNIATYILDGHKYSFLAYSKRPFINYSANNFIIPTLFLILYLYEFVKFQLESESQSSLDVFIKVLAFIAGICFVSLVMYWYFKLTNKNWYKYIAGNIDSQLKRQKYNRSVALAKFKSNKKLNYRVDYFYSFPFRIQSTKVHGPHRNEDLLKVFDQNHLNAIVFLCLLFLVTLILVFFDHISIFQIPAAASLVLLVTLFTMTLGFIYYWFKKWYLFGILMLVVVSNFLMGSGWFQRDFKVTSMNYEHRKPYSKLDLMEYKKNLNEQKDSLSTISILNNWRSKYPEEVRPKMVILCVSGGGHRASNWTFEVLTTLDSALDQKFLDNVSLITGASGGMIGAGYFRELALRRSLGHDINIQSPDYQANVGKDILNPIALKMLIHDPFIMFTDFFRTHDRGKAFEIQLNKNTDFVLDKSLKDYVAPEKAAQIPMMFFAPTIVQNGSKLYISSQPMSYMVKTDHEKEHLSGIELRTFFNGQVENDLNFVNVLRMSASFPYISPVLSLPTEPRTTITDAGISDTYGIKDAISFSKTFSKWINENTSGLIILSVRDSEKYEYSDVKSDFFNNITQPFDRAYQKFFDAQDIYNDQLMYLADSWIDSLEFVSMVYETEAFEMDKDKGTRKAALSWHLTQLEKENITNAIYNKRNIRSARKIELLLGEQVRVLNGR